MISIRYATTNDKEAVMQLWAEAFGADEPYFSWYFQTVYRPERTLCLFDGQRLVSSLQYAPKRLRLHHQELPVAYLVGVCTSKVHQGHGYARKLLRHIRKELQKNYQLLMLYTDIPDFYRPLGFTHCYQLNRYHFPAQTEATLPTGWQLGTLSEQNVAVYNNIYQQMTANMDGYIVRNIINWREFIADFLCDGGSLYFNNNAYLLWMIDNQQCKIKEIGYRDQQSLIAALNLAQHIAAREGYAEISWDAPANVLLPTYSALPIPYVMAVSTAEINPPDDLAQYTKNLFGTSTKLWVNEMT